MITFVTCSSLNEYAQIFTFLLFLKNRIFGCPTVRNDIPKYSRQSVADKKNYGNDCNAECLIRPKKYASLGVSDNEFKIKRSKEYIYKTFMHSDHFQLDDDIFNSLFSSVCDCEGMTSIERFRSAYNDKYCNNKI